MPGGPHCSIFEEEMVMEHLEQSVQDLILYIVNEAMEKQDRYVTINFFEQGPCVTIYPLGADDDD